MHLASDRSDAICYCMAMSEAQLATVPPMLPASPTVALQHGGHFTPRLADPVTDAVSSAGRNQKSE